jgi:hypothetical protein
MDIEAARTEIARALGDVTPDGPAGPAFRAAQMALINHGIAALSVTPSSGLFLDDIIRTAVDAAPTADRRDFAVLLVHALGVKGLLPAHGETERNTHLFLERALLNPLRRAGYPFGGTGYEKRQALAGLHVTIGEHLRPPEPTFPGWIHGAGIHGAGFPDDT